MNSSDYFNEWFERYGIRYYSRNHGTADGHREYMAMAFQAGYYACEANDDMMKALKDDNRRLRDEINCLIP